MRECEYEEQLGQPQCRRGGLASLKRVQLPRAEPSSSDGGRATGGWPLASCRLVRRRKARLQRQGHMWARGGLPGQGQRRRTSPAECDEALLGVAAGDVHCVNGAAASAVAAQHVVAEGALVQRGPVRRGRFGFIDAKSAKANCGGGGGLCAEG